MIPYLNQKIWYAFQGLPLERINSLDRLPWSNCLVLTNNLVYILKFTQLTDIFKKCINKAKAEINRGITFEEYINVFDTYFEQEQKNLSDEEKRMRGIASESNSTCTEATYLNTLCKSNCENSPQIKNFDDFCWTLFRTKNLPIINSQSALNDGYLNLWLLFITYSVKCPETGTVDIPVRMDILEAKYWCSRIRELLGARRQFDDVEITENVTSIEYQEFFEMFQHIFKNVSLAESVVETALRELAEEALEGITIKGPIKIDKSTRYCVLKSYILMIYNSKVCATNFRSCFVISGDTELIAGTNKIQIKSPGFMYITVVNIEIGDVQLFNKWRSALVDAIEYAKSNVMNPAVVEAKKREVVREVKRKTLRDNRTVMEIKIEEERKERSKLSEAMEHKLLLADQKLDNFREQMSKELCAKEILIKQNEDIRQETEAHIKSIINEQQAQYKIQLEKLKDIETEKNCLNEKLQVTLEERSNEEMKRTLLQEKHMEAQQMLLQAEEKITSLQKLSEQLEKALEEEKQAKEEEEVVRNATLALLEEEQRSKENLEALLQQQNSMIDQEIQKRNEFALELENEKIRIKNIAEEKEKLTKQLEDTREKMQSTGNRVKRLDTKVSQIAENVFGKEQTRMPVSHRGKGFLADAFVPKVT